jgi:transcription antitermination factor NusG
MEPLRWHALLVRPRFEVSVASRLNGLGLESYVPMLQLSRERLGNIRCIELPLFPGYVMCKHAVPDSMWSIPGVVSMIRGIRARQVVSDRNMDDLRQIVDCGVRVRRWPFRAQGERVIIDEGPLSGISGILERDGNEQLFIFSIHLIREAVALNARSLRLISFRAKTTFR